MCVYSSRRHVPWQELTKGMQPCGKLLASAGGRQSRWYGPREESAILARVNLRQLAQIACELNCPISIFPIHFAIQIRQKKKNGVDDDDDMYVG